MIRLINAGLDYQQALDRSIGQIAHWMRSYRAGKCSIKEALEQISLMCGDKQGLMTDAPLAEIIIATERAHFASHMRQNESKRKWQEAQRRASGVRPREDSSTSTSLFLPVSRQYTSFQQQSQHQQQPPSPQYLDEDEPDFDPSSFQLQTGQKGQEEQIDQILPSTLTPHDIRRLELEMAPTEHQTQIRAGATFEEDLLICSCGFRGLFEAWQQHLTDSSF
jgi:hypothetical protein